jgi:hypothetical protein
VKPNNLTFLELRASIDILKDNLPYIIEHWEIDAESMQARFQALQRQGFTRHEAFEIIKARGAII